MSAGAEQLATPTGAAVMAVVIAVLWLLITWLRWRAARPPARLAPEIEPLLLDALGAIPPAELARRLGDSLAATLPRAQVALYAARVERGQERWERVYPDTHGLPPGGVAARGLASLVDADDGSGDGEGEAVSEAALHAELGVDRLVPVHRGTDGALVAGVRLVAFDETHARLLESWRVTAAAIMQAQAMRHGREHDRELVDETEMAKFLEAAALSRIEIHDPALDWAVRFYAAGDRPYFLTTYTPSPGKTLVVFGRAIASGIAASLVNVSIKSCCDVMVKLAGGDVSLRALGERLNRFLWQPKHPIGAYCHLLLVDRGAGRFELASAGSSAVIRLHQQGNRPMIERVSCQGLPIGTSIDGVWKGAAFPLRAGDGIVVRTEVPAEDAPAGNAKLARWRESRAAGALTAEALVELALDPAAPAPCVLALAVQSGETNVA
jgi:hypothetical protein